MLELNNYYMLLFIYLENLLGIAVTFNMIPLYDCLVKCKLHTFELGGIADCSFILLIRSIHTFLRSTSVGNLCNVMFSCDEDRQSLMQHLNTLFVLPAIMIDAMCVCCLCKWNDNS